MNNGTQTDETHPHYEELKDFIKMEIAKELDLSPEDVEEDVSFANMGITSIQGIQLAEALSEKVGREITSIDFFEYQSVKELAAFAAEDPDE